MNIEKKRRVKDFLEILQEMKVKSTFVGINLLAQVLLEMYLHMYDGEVSPPSSLASEVNELIQDVDREYRMGVWK